MNGKRFYITTPIYYVNDVPHIGHAYTSIAADIIARFKRLDGYKVKFLTGTDEHGQKVQKTAESKGYDPKAYCDLVSESFKEMGLYLNLSNDDFIRTTEVRHKTAVAELWQRLVDSGDIYLGEYSGWYSIRDEAFYGVDEIVDGKAPTGSPVEWVSEPSYFFRLSRWQEALLRYYEEHPSFIAPSARRNEVINFVKGGLTDLSVSRTSFSWGIKVPSEGSEHVIYVWLDALTNYISALGFPNIETQDYKQYWPCDLHLVGKDILRFHTIYWPAFLMAAKLALPKRVFAHGWWTNEGQKISKSVGNVIDPKKLIEEFGLDQTRYFLFREVPFGSDGNFSRENFVARVNAELANNIGNLVQRTLSLLKKNCNSIVPELTIQDFENEDWICKQYVKLSDLRTYIDEQAFHKYLDEVISFASDANKYIDTKAPWTLFKVDELAARKVLAILVEAIRIIAITLQGFTPESCNKIFAMISCDVSERSFTHLTAEFNLSGRLINELQPLFPRLQLDDKKVVNQ